ncbi:hypothetical protein P7C70_g8608, partial [Phenoliferia sp. Uapishka_3]
MVAPSEPAPPYSVESTSTPAPVDLKRRASSQSFAQPPSFSSFPTTFRINGKQTSSLVSIDQIKQHLHLLGAFAQLRQVVEAGSEGITARLDPAARWSVFVSIAVHRFETYIEKCITGGCRPDIPPLDVALVWHSYALNPRCYREDGMRCHPMLLELGGFPLSDIANTIDSISFDYTPSASQVTKWEAATQMVFDSLASLRGASVRQITDPFTLEVLFVPFVNDSGSGYAQQGFEVASSSSGRKITHEVLGIAKLVRDIQMCQSSPDGSLAGTVFSASEAKSPTMSRLRTVRVKTLLLSGKAFAETDTQKSGDLLEWSMEGARKKLLAQFRGRGVMALNGILSAYTTGETFSLDLVTAVLRQGTFVQKMVDLGWTIPNRFEVAGEESTVLQRAACRYSAFVDLISSSPSTFFVPTLDIDLAWHTHQLLSDKYRDDCFALLGRFVDHNDRVEEGALSTAYDVTSLAWKSRYNVPYSICGCPLPDDKIASKLMSKLGFSSSKPSAPTALLGSTSSPTDCDATHASSHNSVQLIDSPSTNKLRAKREKEFEERKKRDEKLEAKGKLDQKLMERRRDGHESAFLYPSALYPYYGAWGYPGPIGGCAAVAGGFMNGDGAAGACTAGAGGCAAGVGSLGGAACSSGGCGGELLL